MDPKVVVVMPAFNAARTLRLTYQDLPKESVHAVTVAPSSWLPIP